MMTKLMIDEKYAKELDKAEIDHHKPTAGAMLGHVLSNLIHRKYTTDSSRNIREKPS